MNLFPKNVTIYNKDILDMTHGDKVKKAWRDTKTILEHSEVYSFDVTKSLLLENDLYKRYMGKAKNRTLLKEHPSLYKSIYYYTKELERLFKKQRSYKSNYNLTSRIKFIVDLDCKAEKLKCQCGKKFNWNKYCRFCPEPKRNQLGIPHSEETKRKMRISTLNYLDNLKGQLAPRYNKHSIKLIEEYGIKNGYRFMHAENGGEYYVKELGYFLDAYDPINNIALEVDESHHFEKNGELKQRDKIRQKQIEEKLGCSFIRIQYD